MPALIKGVAEGFNGESSRGPSRSLAGSEGLQTCSAPPAGSALRSVPESRQELLQLG